MSFRDDWPVMQDGSEYDGKQLFSLVRNNESPFAGLWDVKQLIEEVEENLNVKVIDIPSVTMGSNNYVRAKSRVNVMPLRL